jgi:UDP-glucose 4-epimerase
MDRLRRYLVTGGCGFIGSHLVDALISEGHTVLALDDLSTGKRDNLNKRAQLIMGDVADETAVAHAMRDVDGCFHLAAIASVTKSNEDWVGTHRTNQTGAICIFNAARRKESSEPIPVVYASSAAVYGDSSSARFQERSAELPLTAYGADKRGSELHAHVAWQVHQVPTIGLRFFNVYGPRQNPSSPYSGVISIFADHVRSGMPITIYGDGSQVRDFIHVTDVVACLRAAMNRCHEGASTYDVCTGTATSITDLADLLSRIAGRSPEIRFAPWRTGDIRYSVGERDRAAQELQFRSRIGLAEGLTGLLQTVSEAPADAAPRRGLE